MWTHVDTFSGIGGFALAAAWTGRIKTVQFVEIDPWCRRVLAKHWPGVPIHDDIRTFLADTEEQPAGEPHHPSNCDGVGREARTLFGERGLDLLTGGFPCQPWSAAGKRAGTADDRDLWPELHRVVVSLRPRWCLFENVPGIIRMAGGLERIQPDLGASGYEVGVVVVPAAAVGAYHRRDRVWIIAHRCEDEGRTIHDALAGCERTERTLRAGGNESERTGALRDDAAAVGSIGPQGEQPGRAATGTIERSGGGQETLSAVGLCLDGLRAGLPGRFAFGPGWEDGIPRVTQHENDRVNKLKALGNAIVPAVVYELLTMMLAVDDEWSA